MKLKTGITSSMIFTALVIFCGCNRGALRLYGTGDSFPPSMTGFTSEKMHPQSVYIEWPEDKTEDFYGQPVAGTSWQGTRTDTMDRSTLQGLVRSELTREVEAAGLFSGIDSEPSAKGLVLETEIQAFGSQVRGFLFSRIGGVASFQFTLKKGERVLFEKVYEKVVRDNDDEYTGKSFGMIEDAMRATMSDSYREVLKALFWDLEKLEI